MNNQFHPDKGIEELKINELRRMAEGIKVHLVKLVAQYNDSLTANMPAKRQEIERNMCRSVDVDNALRKFNRLQPIHYKMPRQHEKLHIIGHRINIRSQIKELEESLAKYIKQFIGFDTRDTKQKVDIMYAVSKVLCRRQEIQTCNSRKNNFAKSVVALNSWRERGYEE